MNKRILGGILIGIIVIPALLLGGYFYTALVAIIAVLAYKELLDVNREVTIPFLIQLLGLVGMLYIALSNISSSIVLNLDYKAIVAVLLMLLLPTIFLYKSYGAKEAIYLSFVTIFVGIVANIYILVYNYNKYLFIWLILIAVFTDIFALVGGSLIGKHKLSEISPKKTVEGSVVGIIVSTILTCTYYKLFIGTDSLRQIILFSVGLSIVGQFGDLFFSLIKRENKAKDYSNIIPGHGGILDRIDSLTFILLVFVLIVNYL